MRQSTKVAAEDDGISIKQTTGEVEQSMKKKVAGHVTINSYVVIARAVEEGINYGISRYNKYAKKALSDDEVNALAVHLEREITNALSEILNFEGGRDEVD